MDSVFTLKLQQFTFKDTFSTFLLTSYSSSELTDLSERLRAINNFLSALDSSTNKGFLHSYDLSRFPIISDLLPSFLSSDDAGFIKGESSMETYKWLYNLITLNLYVFCVESIKIGECIEVCIDALEDLKEKEKELYGRLDPSIRHFLTKRGLSIRENVYVGFDTEFTRDSEGVDRNKLVSVQLAVNTKSYITVPKVIKYQISTLEDTTGKLIFLNKSSNKFNYSKVETSIQSCVERVRRMKYGDSDSGVFILNECLKYVKGLNYTESNDHTTFALPRTTIQPFIHFGDSFSFRELIEISSSLSKPYTDKSYTTILDLIVTCCSSDKLSLINGKDRLLEEIDKKLNSYTKIIELTACEKPLPFLQSGEIPLVIGEKRLSRLYLNHFFGHKLCITKRRSYTVIAHLTPADFSMLSDFEELKEVLSIVNGSFVTIGKPLVVGARAVNIRDTMLLAPGGSKSLDAIGQLYGEDYKKIKIPITDLERMDLFLERDKTSFVNYALRDALISLIHAS